MVKLAPRDGERQAARALAGGGVRLVLLYGPDEGSVDEVARALAPAFGTGAERVDIDSAALRDDAGLLLGEASALSLFGAARWIRLRVQRTDEGLAAIAALLNAPVAPVACVLAVAGDLKPTSKLRKLAEGHDAALALGCYSPDARDLTAMAVTMAAEEGLTLGRAEAASLIEATAADRALLRAEIAKLALYLDAAPDHPATVDAAAIHAIAATTDSEDIDAIIAHVLAGRVGPAARAMATATALATNEVRIVKALGRRVVQLIDIATRIAGGEPPERAQRTAYGADARTIGAELNRWPIGRLQALLVLVSELEVAIMDVGRDLGAILMGETLIGIARDGPRRLPRTLLTHYS